ncbi:hypothetical protein ACFX11_027691 [Malus domestica]
MTPAATRCHNRGLYRLSSCLENQRAMEEIQEVLGADVELDAVIGVGPRRFSLKSRLQPILLRRRLQHSIPQLPTPSDSQDPLLNDSSAARSESTSSTRYLRLLFL